MTTDTKEMLQYAAKAAGIKDGNLLGSGDYWVGAYDGGYAWCPHTDDGDGARLEAMLKINVNWFDDVVECSNDDALVIELYADHSSDKQAARRWATFRLAAEIGRRMLCQ